MGIQLERIDFIEGTEPDKVSNLNQQTVVIDFEEIIRKRESDARLEFFDLISRLSPNEVHALVTEVSTNQIYRTFGIGIEDINILIQIHAEAWFKTTGNIQTDLSVTKVIPLFPEA